MPATAGAASCWCPRCTPPTSTSASTTSVLTAYVVIRPPRLTAFVASPTPTALASRNTSSPATRNSSCLLVNTATPTIAPYPTTTATRTATTVPTLRRSHGRDFLRGAGAGDLDLDQPNFIGRGTPERRGRKQRVRAVGDYPTSLGAAAWETRPATDE